MVATSNQVPVMAEIRTWDDVDQALRDMGDDDVRIASLKAKLRAIVNEAKEELTPRVKALVSSRLVRFKAVREFVTAHRKDLGARKTRELTFGTVGWRKKSGVVIRRVDGTLAKLKELKLDAAIRTTEKILKTVLEGYDDETLGQLGVTRKKGDEFFAKPKVEGVQGAEG